MPYSDPPALYGISSRNSNRIGKHLWGKNQFNTTFPLALCLFMRDRQIPPVCIMTRDGEIKPTDDEWKMGRIIGAEASDPFFRFENRFPPYAHLFRNDEGDNIDIVGEIAEEPWRALEVKLTVVPDKTTYDTAKDETGWGPEIVIRPVSSAHALMSVATSLLKPGAARIKQKVSDVLRSGYNKVREWNEVAVRSQSKTLVDTLNNALLLVEDLQRPFLVQPIWRTKGQALRLHEHCFDLFVWSDVSIMRIPVLEASGARFTRQTREVARHVRALYDILTTGDYDYSAIYKGMDCGLQTAKSFSLPGTRSIHYLVFARKSQISKFRGCGGRHLGGFGGHFEA